MFGWIISLLPLTFCYLAITLKYFIVHEPDREKWLVYGYFLDSYYEGVNSPQVLWALGYANNVN